MANFFQSGIWAAHYTRIKYILMYGSVLKD